jgi:hypothetical protein
VCKTLVVGKRIFSLLDTGTADKHSAAGGQLHANRQAVGLRPGLNGSQDESLHC